MTIENAELERKINAGHFEKCENILVGDMLHFDLDVRVTLKKTLKSLYCIIKNNFEGNYNYKIEGTPALLFLFSNSYGDREDHLKAFNKVCSTTSNYFEIYPSKYRCSINLHTLGLAYKWIRTFQSLGISKKKSIYFTRLLHQAYCDYERVNRYISANNITIKNAVSWCDVMCIDSYFVQKWNKRGIMTVSLQHGTYNIGHYGYTHLKSDYLLVHSKFSAQNAIMSGVENKRIVITGAPQNINIHAMEEKHKEKNVIGLIFGGTTLKKYDVQLLSLVKEIATKYKYSIYIKLHPGHGIQQYDENIRDGVERIYESEIDAYQFADLVDILIDDGSTLFVEYSIRGKNAFTFLCDASPYKNDDNIKLGFRTREELEKIIMMYKTDRNQINILINQNKAYLGTLNKPELNYKNFFEKLENTECELYEQQ